MLNVLGRLYKIARSGGIHYAQLLKEKTFGKTDSGDQWETPYSQDDPNISGSSGFGRSDRNDYGLRMPRQVIEDLKIFNLSPPSSFDEVRKARNREIKKFHSDRFQNDPDKLEPSKQIMQIYNAAYSRLEEYYLKQGRPS